MNIPRLRSFKTSYPTRGEYQPDHSQIADRKIKLRHSIDDLHAAWVEYGLMFALRHSGFLASAITSRAPWIGAQHGEWRHQHGNGEQESATSI